MMPSHLPSRILFTSIRRVTALLLAAALPALAQDLARNKPTLASTNETAALVSANAVDGNAATRWSSVFADPQWIRVDLGSIQAVSRVVLNWEGASARDYQIQVSNDGSAWTTLATRSGMAAGARRDDLTGLAGSGRYVRMIGTARTTSYGYSLYDFEVYGGATLPVLPGRVQAEDYKAGGPNVGFSDVTPANEGGTYRTDAVDIQATTDAGGGFNVGWTAAGEWLAYDVNATQAGLYDFKVRVASNVAGTKTIRLDVDGVQAGTFSFTAASGWQSFVDAGLNGVNLSAGNHTLRLTMMTGGININWFEAAMAGGQNGSLAFSSATYNVGEAGGNLTVTVSRTGGSAGAVGVSYATSNGTATAGSDYTARAGTLSFAAGATSRTFTVPIADDIAAEAAETFTLTLSAPTGGATLGSPATAVATITDNDESRPGLPGRLQAEDYKAGGQGVGYSDVTPANEGGAYRADAVDIEACTDAGGGYNVGWTAAGEWLAYDVAVAQAGTFDFTARVASNVAGTKSIRYEVDGVAVGTASFTLASGWQTWGDATLRGIPLAAGNHTLRIVMVTAGLNLNWVEAVRQAQNQAPVAAAGWDESALTGRAFTLDGRASRDPDNAPSALSYAWTQIGGATVTLTGAATARPSFTPASAGTYRFRLQVGDGSATALDTVAIAVLADPALSGALASTRVVYSAPNLDYGYLAQPPIIVNGQAMQGDYRDYHLFPATSPYATRTLDMSGFDTWGNTLFPPIASDASNIPVNGVFRLPSGAGPFPIAFFVHGNHQPAERSEPGYEEAAQHLASHGVLAVSVEMNYMNASGGNGGRAILLLEHLKQFRTWNSTPGHPLQGRVDMNRVILIGHSRGGEAVQHASFFNRLTRDGRASIRPYPNTEEFAGLNEPVSVDGTGQFGPYAFNLSAVVSIAPTESQYMPVDPADETRRIASTVREAFFVIHGSRDSDVFQFVGYQAYDRAAPFPKTTPAEDAGAVKALLYLHNANHNFFNRVWAAMPDGSGRCFGVCYSPTLQLHRDDQYAALKIWLNTIAQAMVLGRTGYLDVLRHKPLLSAALPRPWRNVNGAALEPDFNSQHQDRWRRLVNHFEEDANRSTSSPLPGGITGVNEVLGNMAASELPLTTAQNAQWFLQDTRALNIAWNAAGANAYRTTFSDNPPLATALGPTLSHLSFRVGFTASETLNPANVDQDLTLEVRDFAGNSHSMSGADLFGAGASVLPYHHYYGETELRYRSYTMVMQTLRFPLGAFSQRGVNVGDIAEIRLRFDRTPAGSLYIDDIQITQ